MPTIKIPPVLRASVGGEKDLSASGENVGEVLRDVNVYLNDEDVRVLGGLGTAVGDSDTLVILPAMAGGTFA